MSIFFLDSLITERPWSLRCCGDLCVDFKRNFLRNKARANSRTQLYYEKFILSSGVYEKLNKRFVVQTYLSPTRFSVCVQKNMLPDPIFIIKEY